MCRLLLVKDKRPFDIADHLQVFAGISRDSKEYQGHGWGCGWVEGGQWRIYRDLSPVWDDANRPRARTKLLIAHARSAFRDEGICVENNMPFFDGHRMFVFNGELQGVRIRQAGRIGAEKVFNYVKRFDRGDLGRALARGASVIEKRTRYVRAMNIIMASRDRVYAMSRFNEDPDYFQLRRWTSGDRLIISSEPYPGRGDWARLDNGAVESY